jgi:hemerythrin
MGAVDLRTLSDEYHLILDHLGHLYQESLTGPVDAVTLAELHRLEEVFEAHFAHERDLMRVTRYPDAGRHEETHGLIRRFLDKLAATAERHDDSLFRQEVPFLLHLVLDHRTREDGRFDDFVIGLEADWGQPVAVAH